MATTKARALAKINLTLHVTGQRADGYHLLDSLVGFADVADQLTATTAPDLRLSVSGPFSMGVPTDETNLVMRAAETLRAVRGVTLGAHITLEKHLPHAAGIGSGSSDAAAALNMLAALWKVAPLSPDAPEVAALGADVPVCLAAPRPVRMSGIGEILTPVLPLPEAAMVLVRPPVAVPTAAVFAGLAQKDNPPMAGLPAAWDYGGFLDWLRGQRNDLMPPALAVAPEIGAVLEKLGSLPAVDYAGMSGSGATCFAIVKDMATARHVARIVQVAEMTWWVAPAALM